MYEMVNLQYMLFDDEILDQLNTFNSNPQAKQQFEIAEVKYNIRITQLVD